MTTFTAEVLATIHGELAQRYELHPLNNQVIANVFDALDLLTVGEYDADGAAAGLLAFAAVLRARQAIPLPGATLRDVVDFIADLASLSAQSLHSTTHTIAPAEAPLPVDPTRRVPNATAGSQPTREQWEAHHAYREAMFLPPLTAWTKGPLGITASIMNEAIEWWNRRAAALAG